MVTIDRAPAERTHVGGIALVLRGEGLAILIVAVALYWVQGFNWWMFAVLLLTPDLAMLGYLRNARIGSVVYNLAHTTVWPLALVLVGHLLNQPLALQLGLIWLAHIGMDRAVGYGLKYASGFKDTHLQRV
jgi:Domain of unknown function (DUF4260)